MEIKEMASREGTLKWWAFFVIVLGTLHYLVYISTAEAYPELLKMTVGVAIITICSAAYNHSLGNEPDRLVRNVALAGMFLVVMTDVATLYGHVAMGRDISAARAGEKERRSREQWETDQFTKRAGVTKDLMAAEAQLNQTEAQRARAEAYKLSAMSPDQRRAYLQQQQGRKVQPALTLPSPASEPTPDTVPADTAAGPLKTEAQVKADWRGYLTTVLMLSVLFSFLSTFGTKAIKMYDANHNNIPDYVERIYATDRNLAHRLYPEYARQLDAVAATGQQQSVPVGNA